MVDGHFFTVIVASISLLLLSTAALSATACNGCPYGGKCLPAGYRFVADGTPSYCDVTGIHAQRDVDESCSDNFMCKTNACPSGRCMDTQGMNSMFVSIYCRIFNILNEQGYQACLIEHGIGTAVCGDGVCSASAGETAATCPADCVTSFCSGVVCNDENECTADSCDPAAISGCSFDVIDCSDGDPCTDDFCNTASGCAHAPIEGCTTGNCPSGIDISSPRGTSSAEYNVNEIFEMTVIVYNNTGTLITNSDFVLTFTPGPGGSSLFTTNSTGWFYTSAVVADYMTGLSYMFNATTNTPGCANLSDTLNVTISWPPCNDSDGGFDLYVKGTTSGLVSGEWTTRDDVCFNSQLLDEQTCNYTTNEIMNHPQWFCPYGCSDGACNTAPPETCGNGYCNTTAGENATNCPADCCIPNCEGRQCGSDGCGGTCGSCESWQTCSSSLCVANLSSMPSQSCTAHSNCTALGYDGCFLGVCYLNAYNPDDRPFTISAWIRTNDTSSWQSIVSHWTTAGYELVLNCEPGKICFWDGVGGWQGVVSGIKAYELTHVAVARNGTNLTFYVNGKNRGSVAINASIPAASNIVAVGRSTYWKSDTTNPNYNTFVRYFKGNISNAKIYNRTLGGGEISRLSRLPTCTDSDGGIDRYTYGVVDVSGAVLNDTCLDNSSLVEYSCSALNLSVETPVACVAGAVCVDGACAEPPSNQKNMAMYSSKEAFITSDSDWRDVLPLVPLTTWTEDPYISSGISDLNPRSDPFTISVWINTTDASALQSIVSRWKKTSTGFTGFELAINRWGACGIGQLCFFDGNTTKGVDSGIEAGKLYHIATSRSGTKLTFYVNGVSKGSINIVPDIGDVSGVTTTVGRSSYTGTDTNNPYYASFVRAFKGKITNLAGDDFKADYYNKTLTTAGVKSLYKATSAACQRGDGTPSNVCVYPTLIYHEENQIYASSYRPLMTLPVQIYSSSMSSGGSPFYFSGDDSPFAFSGEFIFYVNGSDISMYDIATNNSRVVVTRDDIIGIHGPISSVHMLDADGDYLLFMVVDSSGSRRIDIYDIQTNRLQHLKTLSLNSGNYKVAFRNGIFALSEDVSDMGPGNGWWVSENIYNIHISNVTLEIGMGGLNGIGGAYGASKIIILDSGYIVFSERLEYSINAYGGLEPHCNLTFFSIYNNISFGPGNDPANYNITWLEIKGLDINYLSSDGKSMAWIGTEFASGKIEVFLYDTQTGEKTRISRNIANDVKPRLYNGNLVWERATAGNSRSIVMFDTITGEERQITPLSGNYTYMNVKNNKLIFADSNGTIFLHDYSMNQSTQTSLFDADSAVNFIQQYQPDNVTEVGNGRQDLENLLVAAKPLGAGLNQNNIKKIDLSAYLSYWKNYNDVVYVEDNYEISLLASAYASLINAPLIIIGSALDSGQNFSGKNAICVGNVQRRCDARYDTEQLRKKYASITKTNKMILINPSDWNISVIDRLETKKSSPDVYNLYGKTSLISPFLASAKHAIIISYNETNFTKIGYFVASSLLKYLGKSYNAFEDFSDIYLIIMSSPNSIPIREWGFFLNYPFTNARALDQTEYADINHDKHPELSAGRIMGMTTTDTSSYVVRDLFSAQMTGANNITFLARSYELGYMKNHAFSWSNIFSSSGYNSSCIVEVDWGNPDLYRTSCKVVGIVFGPYKFDELEFSGKHWENASLITYMDHGSENWAGIYSSELPELRNTILMNDACSTCASYDASSFCNTAIRNGALAHLGAVYIGWTNNSIYRNTINGIYRDGLTLGKAFTKGYSASNNTAIDFGQFGNVTEYDLVFMTTLLGDPTLKIRAPFRLNVPLGWNYYMFV